MLKIPFTIKNLVRYVMKGFILLRPSHLLVDLQANNTVQRHSQLTDEREMFLRSVAVVGAIYPVPSAHAKYLHASLV